MGIAFVVCGMLVAGMFRLYCCIVAFWPVSSLVSLYPKKACNAKESDFSKELFSYQRGKGEFRILLDIYFLTYI